MAHPTWDDGENVVWRAVEQLILLAPAGSYELPVMWIGCDAATRLTNKRDAQGFLVTDRRVRAGCHRGFRFGNYDWGARQL